jgi:hypothetical protein
MLNKQNSIESYSSCSAAKQLFGSSLIGKMVSTAYGQGYVTDCREDDGYMYSIQLVTKLDGSPLATLYTRDLPIRSKTPEEEAEELNIAYEAQESMRRMNLEMDCFAQGIKEVFHDRCTTCLLAGKFSKSAPNADRNRFPRLQKIVDMARDTAQSAKASANDKSNFPRIRKLVDSARETSESTGDAAASTASSNGKTSFPRLKLGSLWGSTPSSTASANTETTATTEEINSGELEQSETAETENSKSVASSTVNTPENASSAASNEGPTTSTEVDDRKPSAGRSSSTTAPKKVVLPRIQKLLGDREKVSSDVCLICGNPVCSQHRSTTFKKEGIAVCLSCERLFELDFLIECVSTPDPIERAKLVDHMVDCYDRCLLVLKYSTQYVEIIAQALEQQKEQQNKIGLGSSGAGVLSGALGIAAAATILTPIGPSLLIASLLFGGSATAVQTGSDAYKYFSEPHMLADRIIALHGMILSILRVTSTLRDAMMRNHIRTDVYEAEQTSLADTVQETLEKNKTRVLAASNMGRAATLGSVAGAEAGVVVSAGSMVAAETAAGAGAQSVSVLSRAGTAAARTVRFARFAGGALSAAVLVLEANAIHSTLKEIRNGSPCEKASRIRAIADEVKNKDLPTTTELDEECKAYLNVLASRPIPPPEVSAVQASGDMQDFPEAECAVVLPQISNDEGATNDRGVDWSPVAAFATPTATESEARNQSSYFTGATSSLFQSISFGQGTRNLSREARARPHDVFAEAVPMNSSSLHNEMNLLL